MTGQGSPEAVWEASPKPASRAPSAGPNLWSHRGLLAVAVGGPVVEVALLWAVGLTSALGIAASVTAPTPFATFHDLRWLLVYHRSWLEFAAQAAALLAFRGAVTALLVGLAWPPGVPRPSTTALLRRVAGFTLASAVLLAPWAGLLFGLAAVPVSWLFFAAVPPVLVVALLVHHGAVRDGWWRHRPPARTIGWAALAFTVLTLSGAALSASPAALRLPVAAAAGLFNAWAWSGIVNVLALRRVPRRAVPLVPVALVLLLAVAVTGATLSLRVSQGPPANPFARAAQPGVGRPVLLVAGFGSGWDGVPRRWLPGDFDVRRFSYRGQDRRGAPLPYGERDSHRPLPALVRLMDAQVEALHRKSGRRVGIVAESEGALVAKAYLAATPDAPVSELIMLSPLVKPARVWYPSDGQDGRWPSRPCAPPRRHGRCRSCRSPSTAAGAGRPAAPRAAARSSRPCGNGSGVPA